MKPYQVLIARPDENREEIRTFHASDYSEALTMAERSLAGIADANFGIPADCYDLARAEGIEFNEADGLLV